MAEAFIVRRGGGGGSGGTLVVTSSGAGTVTVSNTALGKSYSKTVAAGGSVTFKGLKTGEWTVTLSNGAQTTTRPVTINADYSVSVAYFSATISITYPANSNCVVTNSGGQTVASDTNAGSSTKTWTAVVGTTGTYTVTATDGSGRSKSTTVSITADGQVESVTLSYLIYYYNSGDQCTAVTGGWDFSGDGSLTKSTDHMQYKSSYAEAYLSTANKVDLTQISSITFDVEWVGSLPPSSRYFLGITRSKFSASASAAIHLNTTSRNQYSLDVKSISGEYYIAGSISMEDGGEGYMKIYSIWGVPV